MDPDANLEEQLALARAIQEEIDSTEDGEEVAIDPTDVDRLTELVLSLDGWIRKGGFLPKAWRRD